MYLKSVRNTRLNTLGFGRAPLIREIPSLGGHKEQKLPFGALQKRSFLQQLLGSDTFSLNRVAKRYCNNHAHNLCIYGILIQMFWNDHAPPHFHARYGELRP